jgi:decaprenyl-phosphate phosphoribosyltransferase
LSVTSTLQRAPRLEPGAPPAALRYPLIRLLRPRQWLKNAFLLAPVVFAGRAHEPSAVARAMAAALVFCALASAVYVVNDLLDRADDAAHPRKSATRPLAAGTTTPAAAGALAAGALAAALAGTAWMPRMVLPVTVYLAINLAYSLRLKRIPVVDLFCIASGFVVRVWAGAEAVAVPLSGWMLITTLCLALYLAAVKRRQELRATLNGGGRAVLGRYTESLLERYAQTSASAAIVFYAVYSVNVRPSLIASVPLVMLGFFRYGYLVEMRGEGECPTDTVWRDLPLALTAAAWAALCLWAMWPA